MSSYPAVLIGRLGVSKDYRSLGIGSALLDFIKAWFLTLNKTGCRFVLIDAYNIDHVINFYTKNKFDFIFQTEEDEREDAGLKQDEPLITRTMYFDLLPLFKSSVLKAI